MALNPNKDLKKYFSIHEVAKEFGVAESLLRYWETEFPQIKPHKAGRNVRQYTKEDIETIRVIYNLLKVRGLKIAKARELLNSNKEGAQSNTEVLIQLREIREKLIHLRKAINHIDVDSLPDEQQ